MNLSRLYRKTARRPLKTYWWRYDFPQKLNFGDEITPLIIERLFGLKPVWADPSDCEIAGAGSIIEILQAASVNNKLKVWGSGFIKPGPDNDSPNLEFFAVRGKLSLARISQPDAALGDPALLLPLIMKPDHTKKYRLGVVPHYVDHSNPQVEKLASLKGVKIINALDAPDKVIQDVVSCELIFSSSLHGLIVADAFKVPNCWTPFSDLLTGGDYKFRDYYSVYGEEPGPFDTTKFKLQDIDKIIASYVPKDIESLQKKLQEVFPY
jgi:pyruvyltransferase